MMKPDVCPKCGSKNIVSIQYGQVNPDDLLIAEIFEGHSLRWLYDFSRQPSMGLCSLQAPMGREGSFFSVLSESAEERKYKVRS